MANILWMRPLKIFKISCFSLTLIYFCWSVLPLNIAKPKFITLNKVSQPASFSTPLHQIIGSGNNYIYTDIKKSF